jgi:aryl-alcohol dehydrogenase (NADP+)
MRQLTDNLGAADLHLDADATAALDAVSVPTPGGYPYGAFGSGQRALPRRKPGTAGSRRRRK